MFVRNLGFLGTVLALCTLPITRAGGTTVTPQSLATLSDHAACVFSGTVTSVASYWVGTPPEIESEVILENLMFLKGAPATAAATITLTVPGGTIGPVQMRVAGAPEFQTGRRWLLFLLPEYRTFPVVGIWEGAFRIETGPDGADRIYTASGEPIETIDATGFVRPATAAGGDESHCVGAERVTLTAPVQRADAAPSLTLDEFVGVLRPILRNSKSHPPIAGRRMPVVYRPVPLIPAERP